MIVTNMFATPGCLINLLRATHRTPTDGSRTTLITP